MAAAVADSTALPAAGAAKKAKQPAPKTIVSAKMKKFITQSGAHALALAVPLEVVTGPYGTALESQVTSNDGRFEIWC